MSSLLLSMLTPGIFANKTKDSHRKPNVLFILVDDLGYHDLGYTGSKYYETPNIDLLANQSMIFTNGYANSAVSSPSRASILTGNFTARHGVTDYIGAPSGEAWRKKGRHSKLLPADYKHNLPHNDLVLPEAIKMAGYKTFFAGKWHLGDKGSYPENHGFDINIGGYEKGGPYGGYFSPFKNPKLADFDNEKGMSLPMRLAKETGNFITEHKDTAFFAYLSFYAVHAPIQTTQVKWDKYRQKAESLGVADSAFVKSKYMCIRLVQDNPIYAGLIEMMDDAIGHVLNVLDDNGLSENTIIIFTSDNGGVSSGDDFATSNLPLRGGKGYQFEGGIREPYLIKVPWMNNAGKKCDVPVMGSDLYPTILDLIGSPLYPQEHTDGLSLVPLMNGKKLDKRPLIWHYPHYGNQGGEPNSTIRLGNWKLIHYYEDGRKELYNLKKDIAESNDMAFSKPKLVRKLNKQLFDYLESVNAKYPEPDTIYCKELEDKYLKIHLENQKKRLEKQRLRELSKDYEPGNKWWGSQLNEE